MTDPQTTSLHGPGGLLGTPGLGVRKWGKRRERVTTKPMTRSEAARVAALARWGKYQAKPQAPTIRVRPPAKTAAPPKSRSGRGRAAAKPKPTPEQRQAARQQAQDEARRANEAAVGNQAGLGGAAHGALMAFARPDAPTALTPESRAALTKAGMVETAPDGSDRLTAAGRAYAAAARQGDVRAASDALSRGAEAVAKPAKGGGGGGGGGSEKPTDEEKRAEQQAKRQQTAAQTAPQVGLRPAEVDALRTAAEGGQVAEAEIDGLAELGLITATGDNQFETTDQGRRALSALERGDVRGYRAAVQDAKARMQRETDAQQRATERQTDQTKREQERQAARAKREAERTQAQQQALDRLRQRARAGVKLTQAQRDKLTEAGMAEEDGAMWRVKAETYGGVKRADLADSVFAMPGNRSFPIKTAQDVRNAVRSLGRTKHSKAAVKRGIIRRARAIGAMDALPESWRTKEQATFAVYKDARGQLRWLARSTTSYRDRDGEILSEAALDADSQRMTATRQFGPLRWWHAGRPDPTNSAAPWGPGLDLGMCDYSCQIGRTRVESGTFATPAIGHAVARIANTLALSPGFFHAPNQPRPDGVYTALRTFERSLVPTQRAPAANLFTGLTVKETRMDPEEIARRFKAAITDLGLTPDQAAALGADIAQTDKAAAELGVAYKAAEPDADAPPVYTGPDGQPGLIVDGRFVALKAASAPPPPPAAAEAEMAMPEAKADDGMAMEVEVEPDAEPEGDYIGDLSRAEFLALLQEALAPLSKALDVAGKMAGYVDEMKSMFATKSAGSDAQIAALAAKIADLAGDAPTAMPVPSDDLAAALKSAGPQSPPDPNAPVVPNDPSRPFAAIAARTMPDLYRQQNGVWAGWTPPEQQPPV